MTDATAWDEADPERIWLDPRCLSEYPEGRRVSLGWRPEVCQECGESPIEYLRIDIALARERTPELRGFEAAIEFLADHGGAASHTVRPYLAEMRAELARRRGEGEKRDAD